METLGAKVSILGFFLEKNFALALTPCPLAHNLCTRPVFFEKMYKRGYFSFEAV